MSKVKLGSKVGLIFKNQKSNFEIVENTFSDPGIGKISLASPLGSALFGRSEGEEIEVKTTKDIFKAKILKVL